MNNNRASTDRDQKKAQQIENKSHAGISRLADLVSTYVEQARADEAQKKTDEQKKSSKERLTRNVAYAGFVVAVLGLFISAIQARTAHLTLYEAQRAYLSIGAPNSMFVEQKSGRNTYPKESISVSVTNGGNTVARNVKIASKYKVLSAYPKESDAENLDDIIQNSQRIPLGPRQSVNGGSVFIDFDKVSGLGEDEGTKGIIYYGTIRYDDIFNNKHRLDFCWFYDKKGRPIQINGSKEIPSWGIMPIGSVCSFNNCVDEDCAEVEKKKIP